MAEHVDDEDKLNNESLLSFELNLGQRGGWLINENGLYSLIIGSKLPKVKQFKGWITSEVLLLIRKSGKYEIINSEVISVIHVLLLRLNSVMILICSPLANKTPLVLQGELKKQGINLASYHFQLTCLYNHSGSFLYFRHMFL